MSDEIYEYTDREDQLSRRKVRPATPGEVVLDLLETNGMTQGEFAAAIGVSRLTVNRLIQGHFALTPDLAHRIGRFFGNGPGLWLRIQAGVDEWDALHMDTAPYKAIVPLKKMPPREERIRRGRKAKAAA
jgi:addiction module HigA family antidote